MICWCLNFLLMSSGCEIPLISPQQREASEPMGQGRGNKKINNGANQNHCASMPQAPWTTQGLTRRSSWRMLCRHTVYCKNIPASYVTAESADMQPQARVLEHERFYQ